MGLVRRRELAPGQVDPRKLGLAQGMPYGEETNT
jgi:hypothetical protein